MRKVTIDQAKIASPGTAEIAACKLRLDGGAQLDRGVAVINSLCTPRGRELCGKSADDMPHSGKGHCRHMLLVGHRQLIGDQNAVHATRLQRFEIALGGIDHARNAAARIIQRIARQRLQMQHANDRFLGPKHRSHKRHGQSPLAHRFAGINCYSPSTST